MTKTCRLLMQQKLLKHISSVRIIEFSERFSKLGERCLQNGGNMWENVGSLPNNFLHN